MESASDENNTGYASELFVGAIWDKGVYSVGAYYDFIMITCLFFYE